MLIPRTLQSTLTLEADEYPFILIEGMPKVGKSTLAKALFSDFDRVDFSDIQTRSLATLHPAEFFALHNKKLLIDSIELAPNILQSLPDFQDQRRIVLVGNIPEALKRTLKEKYQLRVYHLMPLSQKEQLGQTAEPFASSGEVPLTISYPQSLFFESLRHGFMPRSTPSQSTRAFYDQWLSDFFHETVMGVMRVAKVDLFLLYLKALAQNNMQEINHSRLAKECRISYATAIYWTQFLVDCGVLIEIPSLKLAQRRQVKRGKMVFSDTGLLCHLLNIGSADELLASEHYNKIFSGFVAAEIAKGYLAWGEDLPLYFYRDTAKKHVELLLKTKKGYMPIGFLSDKVRPMMEQLRHMDVLRRMNEVCTDNVFITDGSTLMETSDFALVSATRL